MGKKEEVHKFKKDRYVKVRGGNSNFLDLYCSGCNNHLLLYQKDGQGSLLRLYLDRIFEPQELALLQSTCENKSDIPSLKCFVCEKLIAIPMVYKKENRLALSLVPGSFIKKKSEGNYPPQIFDVDKKKGDSNDGRNSTIKH